MLEHTLEEDIADEFKGGTLTINSDESNSKLHSTSASNGNNSPCDDDSSKPHTLAKNFKNDFLSPITQKLSDTLSLRRKSAPANSTALMEPMAIATRETAMNYFTFREGNIENAVKDCEKTLLQDNDGKILIHMLLTEINLWDSDKERLVILTERAFISVKYDFIALKILNYKKIQLEEIDDIVVGDLVYPNGSLVPHLNGFAESLTNTLQACLFHGWSKTDSKCFDTFRPRNRNMRGVRLMWNKGQPLTFSIKWNPFKDDAPICTLTSHPLYYYEECGEDQKRLYDVEEFMIKLRETIGLLPNSCNIHHNAIVLQNYVGLSSLIHNRNSLGYFKVRGKFSF